MKLERELLVVLLREIHSNIAEAAAIAKAAEACAAEGYIDKAFTISLDIEQLIFDANNLLQAASVIRRQMGDES